MATSGWWTLLIAVFLLAVITRTYPLTAFSAMLMLISLVSLWWKRRALRGVSYQRRMAYQRGFPGETLVMKVEVENRKFLPLPWLRALDAVPNVVGPEDERLLLPTHLPDQGLLSTLYSLRWYERDRRTYTLLLRQRGIYRLGPARLEAGDLFGLYEAVSEDGPVDTLTVFPEPLDFDLLKLPTGDPYGDQRARRRLYEDPNQAMGVRDYHPEDDFRRIHWPATAHVGELQVKVFQPVSARVMVVCLNVLTLPHYWEGTDPALLEHVVRVAAAVCQRGLQNGYRVGLVSNTTLSHADQPFRVQPSRSPLQLTRLLSALAGATPFVTSSFDRFLMNEAPRLPFGSTLVVITGLMDDPTAEALMRLKRSNRIVTLLYFGRKVPAPLPGVRVFHRPFYH